jgi:Zn-dependent peptidase ImmA (M78 family)
MRRFVNVSAIVLDVLTRPIPRLNNGVAVDVARLIEERYDFDIAYIPNLVLNGVQLQGALLPEHRLIIVEANDSIGRQRFTLAHELGHLLLDFKNYGSLSLFDVPHDSTAFRCGTRDLRYERQAPLRRLRETLANKFAAELLMPEALCRRFWHELRDVTECAKTLGASREAMEIRFGELGLPF